MTQKSAIETAQELLAQAEGFEDPWLLSYADLVTNLLAFMVLLVSLSGVSFDTFERIEDAFSSATGKKDLERLSSEVARLAEEEGLEGRVKVGVDREGLAIQLQDQILFPSGVASLSGEGTELVQKIARLLTAMDSKYRFLVEGHTDDVPIATQRFRNNWDLSAARALEVRQKLSEAGVSDNRLSVVAYADTRPSAPAPAPAPADEVNERTNRELRRRNRRVVIRVYF